MNRVNELPKLDIELAGAPRWIWLLLVVMLVGSFGVSMAMKPHSAAMLVSDSAGYRDLGVQILRDHSYSGTYRAPGYPMLLATIYSVAGEDRLWPVYLVQSLLLVLTLLLTYLIALKVTRDRKTAGLGFVLCCAWPPITFAAGEVMTETLAGLFMAGSVLCLMWLIERPRLSSALLLGVLLGVASLTKGTLLLFALIAPALLALSGR